MNILFNIAQAESTCTLNGQVIPCEDMPMFIKAIMIAFPVLFGLIGLFAFIFWIYMLIAHIKNMHKFEKVEWLIWLLVILATNILGAIIYYFVERRGKKNKDTVAASETVTVEPKDTDNTLN